MWKLLIFKSTWQKWKFFREKKFFRQSHLWWMRPEDKVQHGLRKRKPNVTSLTTLPMVLWSLKANDKTYLVDKILLPEYVPVLFSFPVDVIDYPNQKYLRGEMFGFLVLTIPGTEPYWQDVKAAIKSREKRRHRWSVVPLFVLSSISLLSHNSSASLGLVLPTWGWVFP